MNHIDRFLHYTKQLAKADGNHSGNDDDDDDDDDDFFTKRAQGDEDGDAELFDDYVNQKMDEEKKQRVRGFLDATPEDEKERFLLDYVKNMRWKEEDDDYVPRYVIGLYLCEMDSILNESD